MGIQEILTYMGPVDVVTGQRGQGASKERRAADREGSTDRVSLSDQAKSKYQAEQSQKFDIVRERVRMGYYLKREVLDQVIDSMKKEFGLERQTQPTQ